MVRFLARPRPRRRYGDADRQIFAVVCGRGHHSAGRLFSVAPYQFCTAGHVPFRRRSEEHTSELQSLMRISYAVFCLKKKKKYTETTSINYTNNMQYILQIYRS